MAYSTELVNRLHSLLSPPNSVELLAAITAASPGQAVSATDSPMFVGETLSGATASTVATFNASKALTSSTMTDTQLGYLANAALYSESVGTASAIATVTRAALSFGTTTPGVTLTPGKWNIEACCTERADASSNPTITTYILRRTNAVAADLSVVTTFLANDNSSGVDISRTISPKCNLTVAVADTCVVAIFAATDVGTPTVTKAWIKATPTP